MRSVVNRVGLSVLCSALLISGVMAQTAQRSKYASANRNAVTRRSVPPAVDADSHFQRVLANSQVRVFRVEIGPNESTPVAAHPHDYLVVSLGTNDVEAVGDVTRFPLQMGDGETQIVTGGWAHKLVNRATQPANLLILEVVHGISPEQSVCGLSGRSCGQVRFGNTADGRYSQTTLFETATVRLMRAELGPGGVLPKHEDASDHLLLTLTQARLGDGLSDTAEQPAGNASWSPGGLGTVKNSGTQDARMLILEVK